MNDDVDVVIELDGLPLSFLLNASKLVTAVDDELLMALLEDDFAAPPLLPKFPEEEDRWKIGLCKELREDDCNCGDSL